MRILGSSRRPGEEPIPIRPSQKAWTILLNVFVDQTGQIVSELEGQIDPILDIVMREYQPVGRVVSSRFDQVLIEANGGEICGSQWCFGQDRDADCDLCSHRRLDRSLILQRTGPLHEL